MKHILLNERPLSFYLENPSLAREINGGDLQDLLRRFPYSEHVHRLSLVHSYYESGQVDEGLLQRTAALAQDRRSLAAFVAMIQSSGEDGEAVPVTSELSDMEPRGGSGKTDAKHDQVQAPVYLERKEGEPKVQRTEILVDLEEAVDMGKLESEIDAAPREKPKKTKKRKNKHKKSRLVRALKDLEQKDREAGIVPDNDAFVQWLRKLEEMGGRIAVTTNADPKPQKKRKEKKKRAKPKKRSSDVFDVTPISETLADILVQQGRTRRAIDMYKELSLIYPQKSSFFAAKIRDLANEI